MSLQAAKVPNAAPMSSDLHTSLATAAVLVRRCELGEFTRSTPG